MIVKLINHTPDPERQVAISAKLCYSDKGLSEISENLKDEEIEKFIKFITKIGHGSVLDHIMFNFEVEGVSRITEIQLVRKRIGTGYSIQSGRYVNRIDAKFIKPPRIESNSLASKLYDDISNKSREISNEIFTVLMLELMGLSTSDIMLLDEYERVETIANFKVEKPTMYSKWEKMCIEDSRYAHLQSISTKIAVSFTGRALLEFLQVRLCNRTQWEIRSVAFEMLKEVMKVAPNIYGDVGPKCLKDKCPEGNLTCGKSEEVRAIFNNLKTI